jgi:hypothetical protein
VFKTFWLVAYVEERRGKKIKTEDGNKETQTQCVEKRVSERR